MSYDNFDVIFGIVAWVGFLALRGWDCTAHTVTHTTCKQGLSPSAHTITPHIRWHRGEYI